MNFLKIYALIACIWMAFHFLIFIVCMLTLKREEVERLEELYTRPIYHIIGVVTDGIFWPITVPYKIPKIIKAIVKAVKAYALALKKYKNDQNGSKKGD